jgi:hypothetical protein
MKSPRTFRQFAEDNADYMVTIIVMCCFAVALWVR